MSERITAANLDEVIGKNEIICEQINKNVNFIWSECNSIHLNSPVQLAWEILRSYGVIQLPIDNHYLSGAIFVRDGKKIPVSIQHFQGLTSILQHGMKSIILCLMKFLLIILLKQKH